MIVIFGTHCQVSPSCALLRTVDPFKANVKTRRSIEAQRERIDRRVVGVQVQGGWGRAHALVLNTSRVVNLNYIPRSPGSPRLRPIRQPVCINFLSTSCVSYLFITARNKTVARHRGCTSICANCEIFFFSFLHFVVYTSLCNRTVRTPCPRNTFVSDFTRRYASYVCTCVPSVSTR